MTSTGIGSGTSSTTSAKRYPRRHATDDPDRPRPAPGRRWEDILAEAASEIRREEAQQAQRVELSTFEAAVNREVEEQNARTLAQDLSHEVAAPDPNSLLEEIMRMYPSDIMNQWQSGYTNWRVIYSSTTEES